MTHAQLKSLSAEDFILEVLLALGSDLQLPPACLSRLVRGVRTQGYAFATKQLPLLSKAMYAGLRDGIFRCPREFSKAKGSQIPAFLNSLFAQIFDDQGVALAAPNIEAIRGINQFCSLVYKANLPCGDDAEAEALAKFVQADLEIGRFADYVGNNGGFDDDIVNRAALMARELLRGFDFSELNFKDGPGATADCDLYSKKDSVLPAGGFSSPLGGLTFFNVEDALTRLERYPTWTNHDYFRRNNHPANVAEVVTVPKDSRGPRVICKEPRLNQWLQQGIRDWWYERVENHRLTRGYVNFRDQSINRQLALDHSMTRKFSTLDLKEASDRISFELCRAIYGDTAVWPALVATRSSCSKLPDGTILELKKFAPMGSAMCFPVLATTIWLLVQAAYSVIYKCDNWAFEVYVYGDDLIVPTESAEFVIGVLTSYGLMVNVGKSFINSPLLESCGLDSYAGHEIGPIRLSEVPPSWMIMSDKRRCPRFAAKVMAQRPDQRKTEMASKLVSICATANLLAQRGYRNCAEKLFDIVETSLGSLPYGSPSSSFLCRWDPSGNPLERSLLEGRLTFVKKRKSSVRLEGESIQVWVKRPTKTHRNESEYGFFQRLWPSIGKGPDTVLHRNEHTTRREYELRFVTTTEVAFNDVSCDWLPS